MKKILILETSAFYGRQSGGSYLQANYYKKKFKKKGYKVEFYIGNKKDGIGRRYIDVIKKIIKTDYLIGFGTPMLASYLQWLSFLFRRKGVFCIDTIITSIEIIKDNINKGIFSVSLIRQNLRTLLLHYFFSIFIPPHQNLINISSCAFIRKKLINTSFLTNKSKILYPRVKLEKREQSVGNNKVLFYGTLYRGRGIIDLVKACRILWDKQFQFNLEILGWPVEPFTKRTLLQEIKKKYKDKIILKEKVKNIYHYLRRVTVVVLPFRYPCSFQTPYTLLEPMGLGIPVITTNVGSHGEWIKHNNTGLICKKEDPMDIALEIETVFNNPLLVEKITHNAYVLLEKRFKKDDVLIDMFDNL